MRKSLLAMAALMGVAVVPSKAAMFRVDEQTFANMGLQMQIWGQHLGKQTATQKNRTDFSINNAKVYFSGQVNKLVRFHAELDASLGRGRDAVEGRMRIGDAHINLHFAPEFQLLAGYQRLPFTRTTLASSYAAIIPTMYGYGRVAGGAPVFEAATMGALAGGSGSRDAGVSVRSDIADGMLIVRAGIFDGRFDNRVSGISNKDENLAYAFRVQFTPTMLGYKAEKGYSLSDTYLGKQNVLTLGFGYNTQKRKDDPATVVNEEHTWKQWTVDAQWEQKYGDMIPNVQLGYIDLKDYDRFNNDAKAFWVQGQLLYDQVVGFGKPALALGWFNSEQKPASGGPKPKVNRYAVYFNYYIKGQNAKIQLGLDTFSRNSADKGATGKNYTDFTLALQTIF